MKKLKYSFQRIKIEFNLCNLTKQEELTMSKEAPNKRLLLIEEANAKIQQLKEGSVFRTDFASADLLERMSLEIKLLSFENKNLKKKIKFKDLYAKKQETVIEELEIKNKDLIERLLKHEQIF